MSKPRQDLPRLFRRVPRSEMPASNVVATLDVQNNLLRINGELFDQLDEHQQRKIEQTTDLVIAVDLQ